MLFQNKLDNVSLSPDPLLRAFDEYRGTIHDLDRRVSVSRESLSRAVAVISSALERLGFCAGRRAVMAVSNGPLFVASLISIIARGGAPLLVHAETPTNEIQRIAGQHGVEYVVTDLCSQDELRAISRSVRWVSSNYSWLELAISQIDFGGTEFLDHPCLKGVPLHPTSGTTGMPKLAVRPAPIAVAEATNYIKALNIDQSDFILCTVPMSHAYGYGLGSIVPIVSGADLVTIRRFHPKRLATALREYPVTILPLVPAMLELLVRAAPDSLRNGPRQVTSAGAPLSDKTALNVKKLSGTIVRPLYGTTETGVISVTPEGQELNGSSVGPPIQGVEARIKPLEGPNDHPEGIGRLFIRSSSMMSGYLQQEGLDVSIVNDGWFETGDLARIDENGVIHLRGREKETINVFGMKVLAIEVEEVLAMMSQITDCKVYPGRHHSGSEIVKAAVVVTHGLDVASIRIHCKHRLARYKRPEVIHIVKALPRTAVGKIIMDQLP